MITLPKYTGFEWDNGNQDKNRFKHKVLNIECEEIFFNQPLLIFEDHKHSHKEERLYALGRTNNRFLFISFTLRGTCIRVISARSMNKKERKHYETATKKNSII